MNRNSTILLAAFILAVIAYRLFGYIGHYGYDDLHYAKLAVDFNNGIVDYNDHFTYRTPVILFTALSYSLFGISDFASSVPSMIITIAIIFIVYLILKKSGTQALVTGLALTVFSPWFIFYSDKLMPDMYVALSVVLSLFIIYLYKFSSDKPNPIVYSIALCLSLLFGFMAKGTVVLFVPVLIYLALVDFLFKRDRRFWIYTFILGVIVFITYFLVTGLITGNALKRFEAIVNNSYLNQCSYEKQPATILIRRITYQFFSLLVYQVMATGFIFLVASMIRKKSAGIFHMNDSFSFWTTSALILLLSSNFMTISLTSYSPMCLDPRHYLFLVPVAAIPAATIISRFLNSKKYKFQIIASLALISVAALLTGGKGFFYHYMPLFVIFVLYLPLRISNAGKNVFLVLFVLAAILMPVISVDYARKIQYPKQKKIFIDNVISRTDSLTVITNDVQKRLGTYYNKFSGSERIRFVNYQEFINDTSDHRKKVLFMNWYTRYLSGMNPEELPYYARNISEKNKLIHRDEKLNIAVYEMNEIAIPGQSFRMLLHSENSFEEQIPYWSQNNDHISTDIKYSGDKSDRMGEYSSSFSCELDSLDLEDVDHLSVMCRLYCYFYDRTDARLVVSVEEQNKSYIWYGLEINKYLKAYSNWWPVQHEVIISKQDLKKNSVLKIYVWNINGKEAFIDDFEIKITGR